MSVEMGLDGKVAVVTGAGTGIGKGIAEGLAQQGVQVVVVGRRRALLEELADKVEGEGQPRPYVLDQDLAAPGAGHVVSAAVIEQFGHADIVISNAGTSVLIPIGSPDSEWDYVFSLRFTEMRHLVEGCLPGMQERGFGRIVYLGGTTEPADSMNGSAVVNGARLMYAKSLSREVGRFGITVNTIAPGKINSEQVARKYSPAQREHLERTEIPAGYFGEPEDVASLVTWMASPLARYLNGEVIAVDGGRRRYAY